MVQSIVDRRPSPPTDEGEENFFPLITTENFSHLDRQLADAGRRQRMISKLSLVGGQTIRKTCWRICSKVFAPQLAAQLNWCGRRG
ncbi:hypothetical protein FQN60_000102, partial [Etheostoma spectabile]